jgi:diguanylate cyclase (GGDEF)-like protein/PAS domain S-box-containing protein
MHKDMKKQHKAEIKKQCSKADNLAPDRVSACPVNRNLDGVITRETYQTLFDNMNLGVALIDPDFNILLCNSKLSELFGKPDDQIQGGKCHRVFWNSDRVCDECMGVKALKEKQTFESEGRIEREDGSTIFIRHTFFPMIQDDGSVCCFVDMMEDITERRRAEEALKESQARYKTLFDSAGDAIFVHDMQGRFLDVNKVVCERYGYTREELLKMTPMDLDRPEDAGEIPARLKALKEKGFIRFEVLHYTRDGRLLPTEATVRLIDYMGEPAALCIGRDVSERKIAEEAVRKSHEQYKTLVDNAYEGIFVIQGDSFRFVNPRLLEMLGCAEEEFLGHSYKEFIHPEDLEKVTENYRRRLVGEETPKAYCFRVITRQGETRWAELTGVVIEWEEEPAVLAFVNDVTERMQAEIELKKSHERYKILFENAGDAILVYDMEGRFIDANRAACDKYGYSREELLNLSPLDLGIARDKTELKKRLEKLEVEGQSTFEEVHRSREGTPLPTEVSIKLIEYMDRPAALCIGRDIAERKRAEKELRLSEKRYRKLVETTAEGYWLVDSQLKIIDVNQAFCDMLGYSRREILGRCPAEFCDEENQIVFFEQNSKIAEMKHRAYELTLKTKKGEVVYAHVNSTTLISEVGRLVGSFAFITDITERKKIEKRLQYEALHDPLTKLGNRTLCVDRIKQAMERAVRRENYYFAVMFIDIDRFKIVNDSLGHAVGDKLLCEVGERLTRCVRGLDTVSRFGGDEFVLILEELDLPREAIRIAKRVRRALAEPFVFNGHRVSLSASYGIVLSPTHYDRAEELLQNANIAMHKAKESGGNRFKVFNSRMRDQAMQLITMESDLRQAIANEEFFIHYQPILSIQNPALLGFEALIRWKHPTKGIIRPADFIPVAEQTGLIHDLGYWILEKSCTTLARWRDMIPHAKDLIVSVNISGRQFSQTNIVEHISRTLDRSKLPPDRLKIEITETTIMENPESAVEKLVRLKNKGVKLCIDDFGTGYSSMSYLQRFPLDHLKIDLSFVELMDKNPENFEIVRAIIGVAHSLNMKVIAEGVERVKQHSLLKQLGCECVQGFLYSKPIPEDRAEEFIHHCADRVRFPEDISEISGDAKNLMM